MDGYGPRSLAQQFRGHFNGEHHLYWHLTRAMADDLDAGGVTATVCERWLDAAPGDVVQLRLLAGIFREVLRGQAPELVPFYPCLGGDADPARAWPVVHAVLERSTGQLSAAVDVAPQTNEVGRSVALLVGLAEAVRRTGMPRVRLLEPGASAGLNLHVDRLRFVGEDWSSGAVSSPVVLDGVGAAGLRVPDFEVVSRRGGDLHPVDAASDEGALYLRSFVWPFQVDRHRRLEGALKVARAHPVTIDRAGGAQWIEERLAEPVEEGVLTVVWQSVTRQYWPAEEVAALEAAIAAAREWMPLAHVTMESPSSGGFDRVTDHSGGLPEIRLDGELLARCDYHGPPVTLVREGS